MNNLISTLIGVLIAIMVMFNGTLANVLGEYTSIVIIHIVGLFSIILLILIRKSKFKIEKTIPLYLYSAGAIGVFTVLFTNLSFSKFGLYLTLALSLLGQTISSMVIDNFGLLGMKVIKFEKKKYIGLFIIIFGIFVMTIF